MHRFLFFILAFSLFAQEPFDSGFIEADGFKIYYEQRGNPHGVPVVVLHGGPGTGCTPALADPIDPEFYRIVMFDQRGCGRSTPAGRTEENTTQHLLKDMERIRKACQIDRWVVFGGGWGTVYAQVYGKTHPEHCLAFVFRGVHTAKPGRSVRVMRRLQRYYPEVFARLVDDSVSDEELMGAIKKQMDKEPLEAAIAMGVLMYNAAFVNPSDQMENRLREIPEVCLNISRLWWHYASNNYFLQESTLDNPRHFHLPCFIVQGRLDLISTPHEAWRLHQAWPGSVLSMVPNTGCASSEPGNVQALKLAFEELKGEFQSRRS